MPSRYRDVYVDVVAPKKDDKPKPLTAGEVVLALIWVALVVYFGLPLLIFALNLAADFWHLYPYRYR